MRTLKILYFATICLPPPFLLVLYPAVFIWRMPFRTTLIYYYPFYFWTGLALLLIDLWCSKLSTDQKTFWSISNTVLGIICLPIYWYRFILGKSDR